MSSAAPARGQITTRRPTPSRRSRSRSSSIGCVQMNQRINITLMSPDPAVATAVGAALQNNGHVVTGAPLRDVRDLAAQLAKSAAPIVLVDLDPQPQLMLPQLERIVARFPTSRFVALASTLESDLLVEAMQTGIRRVVIK